MPTRNGSVLFQVGKKELICLHCKGFWGVRDKNFQYQAKKLISRGSFPRIQFTGAKPLPL